MTVNDMHIAFRLKLDMVDTLNYVDVEPEEIDFWLNQAILAFVNERFTGYKGLSFEQSQKRMEELRVLVTDTTISPVKPTSITKPNAYYFMYPNSPEYWLTDEEEVQIRLSSGVTQRTGVTECHGDQYRWHIDNPFSEFRYKHGKAKPLRLVLGDYVEIISDGTYSVTYYYLRYLRKPATVSLTGGVSCDLHSITHNDILEMATRMAIASLGDQTKYQIKMSEELRNTN